MTTNRHSRVQIDTLRAATRICGKETASCPVLKSLLVVDLFGVVGLPAHYTVFPAKKDGRIDVWVTSTVSSGVVTKKRRPDGIPLVVRYKSRICLL